MQVSDAMVACQERSMADNIPLIDLQLLHAGIEEDIDRALARVRREPSSIGGEFLAAFERLFAEYLGVQEVIGVASGRDALRLGLRALGVGRGDAVITVPLVFGPAVQVIHRIGAFPLFVDIDLISGCMDVDALREMLQFRCRCEDEGRVVHLETGRRVAGLLPVHFCGLPADMASLTQIARCYQLPILEDASQAHGARCFADGHWTRVGSFGAAAAFSFSPSMNLGALANGGAVVTNDSQVGKEVRRLRDRGCDGVGIRCNRQTRHARLDEIEAAVLSVKLGKLDEWNRLRRRAADQYRKVLAGLPLMLPVEPMFAEHVYHMYVVRAPDRDLLQRELAGAGVGTGSLLAPSAQLPDHAGQLALGNGRFCATERWTSSMLPLPMHPTLSSSQIRRVGTACREILRTHATIW